jgi:hypothetical protein
MKMAYARGRHRPMEFASKVSHTNIIKNNTVQKFISECEFPKHVDAVQIDEGNILDVDVTIDNPITHFIAVDGGYQEISVRDKFPSATMSFFQFGALIFGKEDLEAIGEKKFIDPEDMARLKKIERFELAVPTKNIILKSESSLIDSIRRTLYRFFISHPTLDPSGYKFADTLRWFLFTEYDKPTDSWTLAGCPNCGESNIVLNRSEMNRDFTFSCPNCSGTIFLTDVFRLHEAVDNELGAGGILGYLTNLLEHIVLIHVIRLILKTQPSMLNHTMFVKDGPLAFFGQTANMHKPMRTLANYLSDRHNLFLVGIEKSGAFVEHAIEISSKLTPGTTLLLNNEYIYKYIIPGTADETKPYARSSYYGSKLIFKASDGRLYVLTLPVRSETVVLNPKKSDFKNLDIILHNVEKLKCDLYDNALVPIALINKLVSLANQPSTRILEKFTRTEMSN